MAYVFSAVVALSVLAIVMTVALKGATKLGARIFGVAGFRWFDAAPANAALGRRAGMRVVGASGPYVVCVVLYFVARIVSGDHLPTTTVRVLDGPAQEAGMVSGDRVLSIDGKPVDSWDGLRAAVREKGGPRRLEIERAGARSVVVVTPDARGTIGVVTVERAVPVSAGDALAGAVKAPFVVFRQLVGAATTAGEPAQLSGPVGVVKSATGDREGSFLLFVALLASMYWPFVAGLHAFDAVTLAAFRKPRVDSPRVLLLARWRQALLVALVCLVLTGAAKLAGDLAEPSPLLLVTIFVVPGALAHYPLVWLLSRELEGVPAARLELALCALVPCTGLVVGALLIRKASRELAPATPAAA